MCQWSQSILKSLESLYLLDSLIKFLTGLTKNQYLIRLLHKSILKNDSTCYISSTSNNTSSLCNKAKTLKQSLSCKSILSLRAHLAPTRPIYSNWHQWLWNKNNKKFKLISNNRDRLFCKNCTSICQRIRWCCQIGWNTYLINQYSNRSISVLITTLQTLMDSLFWATIVAHQIYCRHHV